MATGQPRQLEVTVTGLSSAGLAEAAAEQRSILLRNALPGETVRAMIRKRRRGVWYGEAYQWDEPASLRVEPPCPNFPRCGGCVLQHLDYAAQLQHKTAVLQRLFAERGVGVGRMHEPVSGPRLHYRYKARLGARFVDGALLLGFREGFSNRIVRMTECRTLAPMLAQALPALAQTLAGLSVAERIPQVELAAGSGRAAFVIRHLAPLTATDVDALEAFSATPGRDVYLQPAGYDSIAAVGTGAPMRYLGYDNPEFGLWLDFLPIEFTQVNPWINRALVRTAVLLLDPRPGDAVIDLFCGIGNFSLALARCGARVLGYESGAGAVARARHNAALNRLADRAEFAQLDLYDAAAAQLAPTRLMLLDPPRSGAGPNLRAWVADATLERVVYVSCNPETLATDAIVLGECGFRLVELGTFDMFPHTAHIETLGLFVRER